MDGLVAGLLANRLGQGGAETRRRLSTCSSSTTRRRRCGSANGRQVSPSPSSRARTSRDSGATATPSPQATHLPNGVLAVQLHFGVHLPALSAQFAVDHQPAQERRSKRITGAAPERARVLRAWQTRAGQSPKNHPDTRACWVHKPRRVRAAGGHRGVQLTGVQPPAGQLGGRAGMRLPRRRGAGGARRPRPQRPGQAVWMARMRERPASSPPSPNSPAMPS